MMELSLKQQLDKKIDNLNANEDKIKTLEEKLMLLDNTRELEEILESLKLAEAETMKKIEARIETVNLHNNLEYKRHVGDSKKVYR